ncbi:hypothetical protein ADK38_04330 [Streptomyces varsoviensis]|uniref:Uncharacterized protein n=1 Tax=Streptomyces varsoviensis TaxID=67373 RepID=A0ABR5JCP2_9ACTN|nr:hypothetical protein ADK38_04330 [Streptomyces varsoviensis]
MPESGPLRAPERQPQPEQVSTVRAGREWELQVRPGLCYEREQRSDAERRLEPGHRGQRCDAVARREPAPRAGRGLWARLRGRKHRGAGRAALGGDGTVRAGHGKPARTRRIL